MNEFPEARPDGFVEVEKDGTVGRHQRPQIV